MLSVSAAVVGDDDDAELLEREDCVALFMKLGGSHWERPLT